MTDCDFTVHNRGPQIKAEWEGRSGNPWDQTERPVDMPKVIRVAAPADEKLDSVFQPAPPTALQEGIGYDWDHS
jgi:hypothetical protein